MYLSKLVLNPASRRVRTESGRSYELHRTLMRAFPSAETGGSGRVLFRLDVDRETGAITILVQSTQEPDWTVLETAKDFLLEPPFCKRFAPVFRAGQVLRFRLRANPTVKRQGKRFGLIKEEEQLAWLQQKGEAGGFEPISVIVIPERLMSDKMTDSAGNKHDLTLNAIRFDGSLRVTDPATFRCTLEQGIGSGKGFGFGLLSVAPAKRE